MFNSQFIEVGIGLVFIFLLMSIMVSGLNEIITSLFGHRGKHLKEAIDKALQDPANKNLSDLIYDHPLVDKLKKTEKTLPPYISSEVFAKTILDVVAQQNTATAPTTILQSKNDPVQNFTDGLNTFQPSSVKTLLHSFVTDAEGDYEKLKQNIKDWYNEYMNRVSGWYKRRVKSILFVIGLLFAILMNVDTIRISKTLWENTVLRESVANAAAGFATANKDGQATQADTTFDKQLEKIKEGYDGLGMLSLPIGWGLSTQEKNILHQRHHNQSIIWHYLGELGIHFHHIGLSTIIGWIFTGIAISFGAPVWFDLLNKLINLRQSVKGTNEKS
jgi:hypothetical protein